jgi:hypothetical protein
LGPYEVCYSSWNRKVFLSISLVWSAVPFTNVR